MTMRCIHKIICLLAIPLLLLGSIAKADPMLNGIALHQELGQEVFIGALFSDTLSNNSDALLNSKAAMRMELKIVAPAGMTTRRFSRFWIEGMAVNNKPNLLTAQADNMVSFDRLFKGRFLSNDHIVFTSTPGRGVDISVNGVLLGNIKDNQFFSMLLSTWIGRVPLSSDFRDALLKMGDVDAGLRGRFAAIAPDANRIAAISAWIAPIASSSSSSKAAEKIVAKASSSAKASKVEAIVTIPKPVIPSPTLTIEKPNLNLATVSSSSASAKAKPDTEEDEDAAPALTAQSLLARQFYVSDILKKIYSKTRYPARAMDRNQEGSVRFAVVIDREGNILSLSPLEESKYDLLNLEASDAIKRSAPFPAIPEAISGARFEFTVPIRFVLPPRK